MFKDLGLRNTVEANMKIINYPDVTLDLHTATFQPFVKPDNIQRPTEHHPKYPGCYQ